MLRQLVLIAIFAIATAFVASKIIKGSSETNSTQVKQRFEIKKRTAIGCSPDWALCCFACCITGSKNGNAIIG